MSHTGWMFALAVGTALLTAWAGFGIHLTRHFHGRTLESYCRLRRRPGRFGDILDWQDEAEFGAQCLFLMSLVLFLTATAASLGLISTNGEPPQWVQQPGAWLSGWLSVGLLLIAIRCWFPSLIVSRGIAIMLFHTWWWWKGLARICYPLERVQAFFGWIGYRLMDQLPDPEQEEDDLEDEIRTLVAAGEREGLVGGDVREMIQGVMKLGEADAQQIMTPRSEVLALDLRLPVADLVQQVIDSGHSRVPIFEGTPDQIVGILFVKDLMAWQIQHQGQLPRDILPLLRDAWRVPAGRRVDALLRDFLHQRRHLAIVVDEFQQFLGVVTIEDAIEEIVGEIADELDEEEQSEILVIEDGLVAEAEGRAIVEHINQRMGWELPLSEHYDTVAGLVISELGEIPAPGTQIQLGPIQITVLLGNARQVTRVRLTHAQAGDTPPHVTAAPPA
jgi:putative hemolysin